MSLQPVTKAPVPCWLLAKGTGPEAALVHGGEYPAQFAPYGQQARRRCPSPALTPNPSVKGPLE